MNANAQVLGNIAAFEAGLRLLGNHYRCSPMTGESAIDKLAVRSIEELYAVLHATIKLAALNDRLRLSDYHAWLAIGIDRALMEKPFCARREPDAFLMAIVDLATAEKSCRLVFHADVGIFVVKDFAIEKFAGGLIADFNAFAVIIENLAARKTGPTLLVDGHASPGVVENLAVLE